MNTHPDDPEIGWAEAVATPDQDVGFVFTKLDADLVGLPVDIMVGDDTPLVIACPRDLSIETIAEIRRWVVRHKNALTDHWLFRIDTMDLIERIKSASK